jgi:hypothetical protein
MTTTHEHEAALAQTRALLLTLEGAEDVPIWVRREAARLLKHYPLCGELTQHLERLRVLAVARTS